MKADVSIAQSSGNYKIKVSGRASFECSPPLRNLAKSFDHEKLLSISIDLSQCESMDSTFMGVLAMLGLRGIKQHAKTEIVNANDFNYNLLEGLGLCKLFEFRNDVTEENCEFESTAGKNEDERNDTVLEAHEVLMEVDDDNVPKFEKVVAFVKKDLGKE